MSDHITQTIEHIVLKADPWQLLDLMPKQHLATNHAFDVYTDREQAISAIKAQYPEYEPPEWDFDPQARIAELKAKLLETDFRMLPDYQARSGMSDEEIQEYINLRAEWYSELKSLEDK